MTTVTTPKPSLLTKTNVLLGESLVKAAKWGSLGVAAATAVHYGFQKFGIPSPLDGVNLHDLGLDAGAHAGTLDIGANAADHIATLNPQAIHQENVLRAVQDVSATCALEGANAGLAPDVQAQANGSITANVADRAVVDCIARETGVSHEELYKLGQTPVGSAISDAQNKAGEMSSHSLFKWDDAPTR